MLQLSCRSVAKCDPWNGRATQIFPTTGPTGESRNSLAKVHVRIFGYQNIQFWFQYFYVRQPKIIADHPGYHLGGPLGDPGFFVSCSIGACMINVSKWHKFGIAIVTLVFPEPGDCWGTLDSKAASVDRSVTGPTTAAKNSAFPIRLLASAFTWFPYFFRNEIQGLFKDFSWIKLHFSSTMESLSSVL